MTKKKYSIKIYAGVLLVGLMFLPTIMAETIVVIPVNNGGLTGTITTNNVPNSVSIAWDNDTTVPDQHDRPTKITLMCVNMVRDGKTEAYSYTMRCRYFSDDTNPSQEHHQCLTMVVGKWITYLNNGTHTYREYILSTDVFWLLNPMPETLVVNDYNVNYETERWDQCKITIVECLDSLPPWYLNVLFPYIQPYPRHLIPVPGVI